MLHGYNQKDTVMRIKVRGWIEENGWYISVEDNGDGMEEASSPESADEAGGDKKKDTHTKKQH